MKGCRRSYSPPILARWLYPNLCWKIRDGEKKIYLTFDDGPSDETSPSILRLLEQYKAKGTFFLLADQIRSNSKAFSDILAKNHQPAIHGLNHKSPFRMSTRKLMEDLQLAAQCFPTDLYRPPYGHLWPWQVQQIRRQHLIIMWDVMTMDYHPNWTQDDCWQHIQKKTTHGSILVFHEHKEILPKVLFLLEKTLNYYSERGFTFEKIQEY